MVKFTAQWMEYLWAIICCKPASPIPAYYNISWMNSQYFTQLSFPRSPTHLVRFVHWQQLFCSLYSLTHVSDGWWWQFGSGWLCDWKTSTEIHNSLKTGQLPYRMNLLQILHTTPLPSPSHKSFHSLYIYPYVTVSPIFGDIPRTFMYPSDISLEGRIITQNSRWVL